MSVLGNRIREFRIEQGMSQEELAVAINTTKATVSRYENGSREPRLATIEKIASALNVTLDEFIGTPEFKQKLFEKLQEAGAHAKAAEQAQDHWTERSESMEFLKKYIESRNMAKIINAVDVQVRGERKQNLVEIYEKLNDSCQEKVLGYAEGLVADEKNLVQYISLPSPFQEVSDEKENPRPKPEAVDVSDPDTDS